jgi:hypothetical protein
MVLSPLFLIPPNVFKTKDYTHTGEVKGSSPLSPTTLRNEYFASNPITVRGQDCAHVSNPSRG